MNVIIITGTPGTGKTMLAKRLTKELGFRHIELTEFIKKNKLCEGYDRKKRTYVVDTAKLAKAVRNKLEENTIIDGHLSHFLPASLVDLCIVLKCNLKKLKARLEKRGYPKSKVRENLDAEIFDVCLNEAKEKNHNIIVFDDKEKRSEIITVIKRR